jgi:hypothetical protein
MFVYWSLHIGACVYIGIVVNSGDATPYQVMSPLSSARVVGFFSLPSLWLAEHNPNAYNAAMADAPAGAGSCSHCGTGILHHVIIRDGDGPERFIGTSCALKVGVSPEAVRYRMTSDQLAARDAKRAENQAEWQRKRQAEEDTLAAFIAARRETVGGIVDMLRAVGTEFHASLASQLETGPLSWRQAGFVAQATSVTGRRNKKNADAWDDIIILCCK